MRNGWYGIRHMLTLGLLLLLAIGVHAEDYGLTVEKKYGLDPDFATNLRVEMIGHRLAAADELPNINFHIIKSAELNAFALPDGRIYVTSAMARLVTDEELAFVLGHEMTHVKEGHAKSQAAQATGGAVIGAIIIAALGGKEDAIRMGADLAGGLTYGHYSRRDERRADDGGVRLMTRLGYDPKLAANAMQRLIDKYGRGDANVPVLGWFADHPDTKDRKERIMKLADTLQKTPLPALAPPLGITCTLDPSAEHAQGWLPEYLATGLAVYCQGRAELLLPAPVSSPAEADTATISVPVEDTTSAKDKNSNKEEALPAVKVNIPQVSPAYKLVIALKQTPAERAATLDAGKGTAVEVTLHWTEVATGFTGTVTACAQTRKTVPWMAHEQLKAPLYYRLDDGKSENIEGTLEAAALRRAAKAFSEIILAGGPVDHSAPVTLHLSSSSVRPGDYVIVVRKGEVVAEVLAEKVDGRNISGTVLWGTHSWKKDDQFAPAE